MVDAARELGAKLIIVDTTGLVDGALGRRLKTHKTDLLRPDYIVGIQKKREIEHLLAAFEHVSAIQIRRVNASELARRKPPDMRSMRREANFARHFSQSEGHIIQLDGVSLWNTAFCTGRPMKWQYMKMAEEALRCKILHAEITNGGIYIISERICDPRGRKALEEQFKTRKITVVPGEMFDNLYVGLADENARVINVGLIQTVDFKQQFLLVLSPIRTISPVRVVMFGSIRISKQGKQLAIVKPGEM